MSTLSLTPMTDKEYKRLPEYSARKFSEEGKPSKVKARVAHWKRKAVFGHEEVARELEGLRYGMDAHVTITCVRLTDQFNTSRWEHALDVKISKKNPIQFDVRKIFGARDLFVANPYFTPNVDLIIVGRVGSFRMALAIQGHEGVEVAKRGDILEKRRVQGAYPEYVKGVCRVKLFKVDMVPTQDA